MNIYFTVIRNIDAPATITWNDLTNSEYAPSGTFTEGSGAVRCSVDMGFAGGPNAEPDNPAA